MDRRTFLKTGVGLAAAAPLLAAPYAVFESEWVAIDRQALPLPRLPRAFDGLRIAFLTDIHHGPFTPLHYVANVVRTTQMLQPDLVILGGDYSLREEKYIRPCLEVLSDLSAPMGVFAVLGNHDYWHGVRTTREGMKAARMMELTNAGVWLERGSSRFRLAGVDDLWNGRPDVAGALGDATRSDACLLVSHNPDLAEKLRDARVGLVLSGHTHGGQVVFPMGGAPFVPSAYGQKYLRGRVEAPATTVYVSRGLGTSGGPVRFGSRPELTLVTLVSA